jgi:ribosomal protein S18 acetylase RimI-like enzyme
LKAVRLTALAKEPAAFATTLAEASEWADDEWEDLARRRADSTTEAAFFAECQEGIIGMVAVAIEDGELFANLMSMWVAREARRSGIGHALVDTVVDWCSQAGAAEVQLWVGRTNEGAIAFYESVGFATVLGAVPVRWDDPSGRWQLMSHPIV